MKLFRMGIVVAFVLTLVYASVAAGQSLTLGGISGRVTDPTGAVIANASVSLKSLDTGEDSDGHNETRRVFTASTYSSRDGMK